MGLGGLAKAERTERWAEKNSQKEWSGEKSASRRNGVAVGTGSLSNQGVQPFVEIELNDCPNRPK